MVCCGDYGGMKPYEQRSLLAILFDSMALIGPDMSRARLRHAIEVLGGVSKKQLKKLEKEYAGLAAQQNERDSR